MTDFLIAKRMWQKWCYVTSEGRSEKIQLPPYSPNYSCLEPEPPTKMSDYPEAAMLAHRRHSSWQSQFLCPQSPDQIWMNKLTDYSTTTKIRRASYLSLCSLKNLLSLKNINKLIPKRKKVLIDPTYGSYLNQQNKKLHIFLDSVTLDKKTYLKNTNSLRWFITSILGIYSTEKDTLALSTSTSK